MSFIGNSPNPFTFDPLIQQFATKAENALKANIVDMSYMGAYRNKIINGDFDIWQRATSATTSAYNADDRWLNSHVGSTKTVSRQAFTLGQTDVPGNPKYFSRTVVTTSAGAANFVIKEQRIEGVSTLAGKTATITFWAKADASKNIALDLTQNFGTTGSPSSPVQGIESQLIALTTAWQKFSINVNIPSISGKTLGSDENDYLRVKFWFDAGSDFNTLSASLGQQSGTFDIAHVSLVEGDATGETDPFSKRHAAQELILCQRYYVIMEKQGFIWYAFGASEDAEIRLYYPVVMRSIPSNTYTAGDILNLSLVSFGRPSKDSIAFLQRSTASGATFGLNYTVRFDAEL